MSEYRYIVLPILLTLFASACYLLNSKNFDSKNPTGGAFSPPPPPPPFRSPAPPLAPPSRSGYTTSPRNAFPALAVKVAEFKELSAAHSVSCGARSLSATFEDPSVPYSAGFIVHHFAGTTGQNRFWIQSLTATDSTQCRGGDVYDITIRSEDTLVHPQRVVDLENGLYEVHMIIPNPGEYTVCVDMLLSQAHKENPFEAAFTNNITMAGRINTHGYPNIHDNSKKYCVGTSGKRTCSKGMFTGGVQERNGLPRCDPNDNRALQGYWYRPPGATCGAGLCEGVIGNTWEGWIFVPYDCYLKLYTPAETWKCLKDKWIVGWGDSTMKQAMSNFVEYHLGVPIFQDTMENLDLLRQTRGKKAPGFFSYRQWDIQREKYGHNMRLTMMWGGCPNIAAGPNCRVIGWHHRSHIEKLFSRSQKLPDILTVSFHIWRRMSYADSEAVYLDDIKDWVRWLKKTYELKNQTLPLVLWNFHPRHANNKLTRCMYPGPIAMEHFNWVLEDYFSQNEPEGLRFIRIDRYSIYSPFHFDELGFVHFGIHYGATRGMCMTGLSRNQGYELSQCVKKTYPEEMINYVWLNYICGGGSG